MRKFQALDQPEYRTRSVPCCVWSSRSPQLRCLLICFNVALVSSGVALAFSTILMRTSREGSIFNVIYQQDRVSLYMCTFWLSVAGIVLTFIACVIGGLVVRYMTKRLLILFVASLVLISMIELCIGLFSYSFFDQVEYELQRHLSFNKFEQKDSDSYQSSVDVIQRTMKCCGVRFHTEYAYMNSSVTESELSSLKYAVPDSCCKTEMENCGATIHPSNIYFTGCAHPLAEEIRDQLVIQGALGFALCILQVMACVLKRQNIYSFPNLLGLPLYSIPILVGWFKCRCELVTEGYLVVLRTT